MRGVLRPRRSSPFTSVAKAMHFGRKLHTNAGISPHKICSIYWTSCIERGQTLGFGSTLFVSIKTMLMSAASRLGSWVTFVGLRTWY